MDDKTLYARLLGLTPPWGIERVELKLAEGEVHLFVALPTKELWVCPECLERAPKIVFDKFHVAKHLNDAVDKVRRSEHRVLRTNGKEWLKGTKHDWLRNPARFSLAEWRHFLRLARRSDLKTARAWSPKEEFMRFWDYRYRGAADRHFRSWYNWAMRSRLEPIKHVARIIRGYYENIATYFRHPITNAAAEGINATIQRVKAMA